MIRQTALISIEIPDTRRERTGMGRLRRRLLRFLGRIRRMRRRLRGIGVEVRTLRRDLGRRYPTMED